ncbi:MAG: 5-oxoprolinase subunit PxpB [SAR202 cluster bacterium]|nr:5-oxoprolinase subunit PxpB [SAR202 cluster bacterium]
MRGLKSLRWPSWFPVSRKLKSEPEGQRFPRVVPAGDSAILIELGSEIAPEISSMVFALTDLVKDAGLNSGLEVLPTYRSVLVYYDPLVSSYVEMFDAVNGALERLVEPVNGNSSVKIIEIPVVYGGDDGPDLDFVANHAGITEDAVIELHSGTEYRVYMLGFSPGFPYLGGLDERIAAPRLKTPRVLVPAGSVGIAESQTGVYPDAGPGGWRIIGRTSVPLFDVNSSTPSLITPATKVRFIPVDQHD